MTDPNPWNDWVTPDIVQSPGLALDVNNAGANQNNSYAISHVAKTVATQDAVSDHINSAGSNPSFWQRVIGSIDRNPVGHFALGTLDYLAKPLHEVQKDYKFIHSVYARHGFLPGFAVTLGVIGGAALGSFGGPEGTVLGATLAASGLRRLATVGPWQDTYKNSFNDSENPNYKVSAGRDLSNSIAVAADVLGQEKAAQAFRATDKGFSTPGSVLSGFGDLAFDVTSDPVAVIGRFGQSMRGGKNLTLSKAGEVEVKYPLMKVIPGVQRFMVSQSLRPITSEQMDMLYNAEGAFASGSRVYKRSLEDIAKSDSGDIVAKYPQLGVEAAGRLGNKAMYGTAEDVHNFLRDNLYFGELRDTLAGGGVVPSRTLLRATIGEGVRQALGETKAYRTFTGYMPYSIDPKLGKLSVDKFRWNAPDAATTVYRIAKFGFGERAARDWAGQYASAVATGDIGFARAVKNQAIFETFKAMGLHDDNIFVQRIRDEINKMDQPFVSNQVYGVRPNGEILSEYATYDGVASGGLFDRHAQEFFNIPNFRAVKASLREAGTLSKVYGKFDDNLADWYTARIFKPFALATAGFGLRVAAAELLPAFARFGVIRMFKSKLGSAAAKANTTLLKGEAKHVLPAVLTALGVHMGVPIETMTTGWPAFREAARRGLVQAGKLAAPEQMELAARIILANDGHLTKEAIAAGHGMEQSSAYQMFTAASYYQQIKQKSHLFNDLPDWTTVSSESPYYLPQLNTFMNKIIGSPAETNILNDMLNVAKNKKTLQYAEEIGKEAEHKKYLAMREKMVAAEYLRMRAALIGKNPEYAQEIGKISRWTQGDLQTFAEDRVDSVLGKFIGKDGTFQRDLALKISAGEKIDINDLRQVYDKNPKSLPYSVESPVLETVPPGSKWAFNNIVNMGFKKFIDPIVNNLARQPLYVTHVAEEYVPLKSLIQKGVLSEDQALRIAQTRAMYTMIPQIHNPALRSQFAQLARNFMPFYFAQEQALKRAYASLKDTSIASPLFSRGLRMYQMIEHTMNNPSFVETDENGNKYIYFPGVGAWGESAQKALEAFGVPMVSGLPISVQGNLVSLRSVLPELNTPGVSPFLAVSGNLLSSVFPQTTPAVKATIGDIAFGRSWWATFMPATWLRTAKDAFFMDESESAVSNAMLGALSSAYYHDQVPGPNSTDYERQQFVDRIRNNARSILMLKASLNLLSPLAPSVSQEDLGLRNEWYKLLKSKGNYNDALFEFLKNHGDRAVSYTVGKTKSTIPGVKYPYTQKALDYINSDTWKDNPDTNLAAFYLIPQDPSTAGDSRNVFDTLVNMHLRERRTPKDYLKQFYIAQGDTYIKPMREQHNAVVAAAKANYDNYSLQQENTRWSAVMKNMQYWFPIWYSDYRSSDGQTNAQIVVRQLGNIFGSDNQPTHEQAKLVKSLLNDYYVHAKNVEEYRTLNISGLPLQEEKQNWQNHLLGVAQSTPELSTIINSVFMKLD